MDPNQEKADTTLKGNESNPNPAQTVAQGKGKGKAVDLTPQDVSMGEDDSSSGEETGVEDEALEEEDDDNMEEIDMDNIIPGGRTRGKTIDFAEAAKNAGDGLEDDEEDDDDDFEEDEEMHN